MKKHLGTRSTTITESTFELSREQTNIVDSALSIDLDQPKHAAQGNPDRHFSPAVDFLFQESLQYISIPLRRNVSARISLIVHNVDFLAGRLIYFFHLFQQSLFTMDALL